MSNYQIVKILDYKYKCLDIIENSPSNQEVEKAMQLLDVIQAKLNQRSN